jgi:DNA-binding winged helix-turn-helix (wHTH) protein
LTARAGEPVTKDELIAAVWGGVVVEESNLKVHISALRKALNDGHDGKRYVVNIPRRGYCFVAPVLKSFEKGTSSRTTAPPSRADIRDHNLE